MTKYIVHLYREMKLCYTDIEADTPEAAAEIARGKPTDNADNVEDCEGENLAALIDVAGDEDFSESVTIDFEAERVRKAAPKLLAALKFALEFLEANDDGDDDVTSRIASAKAAIADAKAISILTEPAAPKLLAACRMAENYLADDLDEDDETEMRIFKALCDARAEANAAGITPAPAAPDIDALLAERRQIAAIWSVEDVQQVRPDLTEDQCWEVLRQVDRRHDAEVGINWIVLECHADDLFGSAPETDEAEEA
jgi:hypothetical protein